jgi:hypothetical protein
MLKVANYQLNLVDLRCRPANMYEQTQGNKTMLRKILVLSGFTGIATVMSHWGGQSWTQSTIFALALAATVLIGDLLPKLVNSSAKV